MEKETLALKEPPATRSGQRIYHIPEKSLQRFVEELYGEEVVGIWPASQNTIGGDSTSDTQTWVGSWVVLTRVVH